MRLPFVVFGLRVRSSELFPLVAHVGEHFTGGEILNLGPPALNDHRLLVFHGFATTTDPTDTDGVVDGIFAAAGGTVVVLVQDGITPPPLDAPLFEFQDAVSLNDNGEVAFLAGPIFDPSDVADPDDEGGPGVLVYAAGTTTVGGLWSKSNDPGVNSASSETRKPVEQAARYKWYLSSPVSPRNVQVLDRAAAENRPRLSFQEGQWKTLEAWKREARPEYLRRLSYDPKPAALGAEVVERDDLRQREGQERHERQPTGREREVGPQERRHATYRGLAQHGVERPAERREERHREREPVGPARVGPACAADQRHPGHRHGEAAEPTRRRALAEKGGGESLGGATAEAPAREHSRLISHRCSSDEVK